MTAHDDSPEPTPESWDVDALWERVRARTVDARATTDERTGTHAVGGGARRIPRWVYVNAATLLLCAAGGMWFVSAQHRAAPAGAGEHRGEYQTSRGQYATIRLADSTAVTLAPESHLSVSARFGEGAREIALEGEAMFVVRHDAAHPLRVRARDASIEDAGTTFDVRAYPGDDDVTVAVSEGSVAITRGGESAAPTHDMHPAITLAAGFVGTLGRHGTVSSVRTPDVANLLSWARGQLSFTDRPLPEVLRTIGRWYDLDIRVSDARLAHRLVNAEFSTQSPAEMIDALAAAVDATVERRGRVVTLRPR